MGVEAPSSTTVRRATRADLLAILRIEKSAFPQPWTYAAFERFLGEPGFMIAESDASTDPVLGYVVADTIENHGQDLGHIKDLAVHPDHRNHGIGSQLLQAAIHELRTQGAASVKLEVRAGNDAATNLYDEFEFDVHHTVPNYYANGDDARVMIRPINPPITDDPDR